MPWHRDCPRPTCRGLSQHRMSLLPPPQRRRLRPLSLRPKSIVPTEMRYYPPPLPSQQKPKLLMYLLSWFLHASFDVVYQARMSLQHHYYRWHGQRGMRVDSRASAAVERAKRQMHRGSIMQKKKKVPGERIYDVDCYRSDLPRIPYRVFLMTRGVDSYYSCPCFGPSCPSPSTNPRHSHSLPRH